MTSSKAAGSSATEAYPWGTLQGDGRLRTTLGVIFSMLLSFRDDVVALLRFTFAPFGKGLG